MNNYTIPNFQYQNPYSSYRPPTYEIVKVNGRGGANAFQMGANSSILLLDETDNIVWLAQTDGAGYKTVTPFKITPYEETPALDISSITSKIEALEKAVAELKEERDAKFDLRGNAKRQQPGSNNKPTT